MSLPADAPDTLRRLLLEHGAQLHDDVVELESLAAVLVLEDVERTFGVCVPARLVSAEALARFSALLALIEACASSSTTSGRSG
jgi:hypothetical protein